MVSFRFHLVSLVAVFLALALGIGMGVTVIDKATVDLLQSRLDGVRNDVNAANQRSSALQTQLDQNSTFAEEANRYLIQDRLDDVSVIVVRVEGINTASLDQLQQSIQEGGGTIGGTITIDDRVTLSDSDDIADLASALGTPTTDASVLRATLLSRLTAVLSGGAQGSALSPLIQGGFLSWSAANNTVPLESQVFSDTRLVLASGANASVPNDQLMVPLGNALAQGTQRRVVAVESAIPASGDTTEQRAVFVQSFRQNQQIRDSISTVDDLELSTGRVAAVLALSQLGDGRTGHYGLAGSASAILPPLTTS